ncbi:hypothetical protein E3E12_02105 [Formicincola oecophyllae]|uniref:Alpha/beta hydrolase n=1 Tax=Formicincola oecophyllae TaxID=2558361 RepID=A0A4Y6U9F7_9PROT|nr:hypothetical protein [Formicincola oecophyllae]QDH13188.2 hypothetical protein E3E12_02105 [Formicincola oecophyllae]
MKPGPKQDFILREASWFQAHHMAVVAMPASHSLRNHRASHDYGMQVLKQAAALKAQCHAPVFALGESQGTVAAVNALVMQGWLRSHGVTPPSSSAPLAGIALLEPVTRNSARPHRSHESLETVLAHLPSLPQPQGHYGWPAADRPVLIVSNQADHCPVTPPAGASALLLQLNTLSSHVHLVQLKTSTLLGAQKGFSPCDPRGPHGYGDGQADEIRRLLLRWVTLNLSNRPQSMAEQFSPPFQP